jgi:TolB-like protein/DNA-binding winged helix-turn-helix (wHTH) protein/Tfp pilus assembly protein PilF
MPAPTPLSPIVCFGVFQLDLKARELHKAGVKIKLQGQPFRALELLVERAGQVVSREELRQKVWPTDVFVTFDQGLNNAIKKVRDALGDSADSPRFIETLARHGYRFIAPVSAVAAVSAEPLPASPPRSRWGWAAPRRIALLALATTSLLAALTYWAWHGLGTRAGPSPERIVLAVLPFGNLSRDPDQEFFSDGLTEEMITQLGKLNPERLVIIASGSVTKYKGSKLAVGEIGRQLHADYLVQGSVRRAADRVRISVQLIQVRDQTDLWAESYDRELKDMLLLQDSVTRTIANQIHVALTPGQQAGRSGPTKLDPEAYEAYLKGRYYWNKRTGDGMQKALAYFQQAIDKDPAYGVAYSGLADCNSGLAWHGFKSPADALPKAHAAALKAIEIDPQSAEAYASLGLVRLHRWDWSAAETAFKHALQLDPNYANAHHWYADYLSINGRHDEALFEARHALQLDPLNLMIGTWVGLRYYLAREYGHAIEQGQSTVELDPSFAAGHLVLGEAYVRAGLRDKGLVELQRAAALSGGSPLYLAQVAVAHALAERKSEALRIAARLQMLSTERYVSPYGLAQIYAALKDNEQTFKWLQAAYDDHAVWMAYLAVDPAFDAFRSDRRFQDLLRRVRG